MGKVSIITKNYKGILIGLLVAITIFSAYNYIQALKEKRTLLSALNQSKIQVVVLENEKQNLLQTLEKEKSLRQELGEKNSRLKDNLRASIRKVTTLNVKLAQTQNAVGQLSQELGAVKAENTALKEEKDSLEARVGSAIDLRKAFRELGKQIFKVGRQIKGKARAQAEAKEEAEGNRGFIVKDGKTTYPAKVIKIEVAPAPKQRE